jgi:hypothetical protein
MRRKLILASCLALVATAPALYAHAQGQADDDARRRAQADADKKKAEKEKQWAMPQAELPTVKNVGPCPFVKVLYDAARYIDFKGQQNPNTVGYTGEITGLTAQCQYKANDPITVQVAIDFALGRGPMARGTSNDYHYWVAVTERNSMVLDKQEFTVRGDFKDGVDRTNVRDKVEGIVIPRATATTSGANFEVLVGFDVTPEMAAFNRDGKRFRANATATNVAEAGTTAAR